MLLWFASFAFADTITLETGVTIEGDLARYELGGDCQVSVTEGDYQGVIVIVPCHRIAAFVRAARPPPVVVAVIEPPATSPTREVDLDLLTPAGPTESALVDDQPYGEEPYFLRNDGPPAGVEDYPVAYSSDDPPAGPDGDAEGESVASPREAPVMPGVSRRPISF